MNFYINSIFFYLCLAGVIDTAAFCAEDDDKPKPPVTRATENPAEKGKGKIKDDRKVVQIKKKMLPVADIESQPAAPGSITKGFEAPGEIMLNADKMARVTPRLAGIATQVVKNAGDIVAAGDVLAVVQSTELGTAKMDYFTANTNLEFAKVDLEREQTIHDQTAKLLATLKDDQEPGELEKAAAELPLGEIKSKILSASLALRHANTALQRVQKIKADNIVSGVAYDAAIKDTESARTDYRGAIEEVKLNYKQRLLVSKRAVLTAVAAFKNAERRLYLMGLETAQITKLSDEKPEQIGRYEIKAPIGGTILERVVTVGEHVEETKEAFVIADMSSVWVMLRVYPQHLNEIKQGQAVRLTAQGQSEPIAAKLDWINPLADERTRSATARSLVENARGMLRPGLFVNAVVIQDETKVPLAVPVSALQTVEGKTVVFVQKPDDGDDDIEFLVTPVLTGMSDERMVEIKAGLKAGEPVVIRNSFILKAELGKGVIDND